MRSVLLAVAGAAAFVGQAWAADDPACAFWNQLLSDQAAPFVKYRAGKVDAAGIAKGALSPSKAFVCEFQAEDAQDASTYPRTYSCTSNVALRDALSKDYDEARSQLAACYPNIQLDEVVTQEAGMYKVSRAKQPPFALQIEAAFDKGTGTGGRAAGKLTLSVAWRPPAKTAP
jgi:hypothetical protein